MIASYVTAVPFQLVVYLVWPLLYRDCPWLRRYHVHHIYLSCLPILLPSHGQPSLVASSGVLAHHLGSEHESLSAPSLYMWVLATFVWVTFPEPRGTLVIVAHLMRAFITHSSLQLVRIDAAEGGGVNTVY